MLQNKFNVFTVVVLVSFFFFFPSILASVCTTACENSCISVFSRGAGWPCPSQAAPCEQLVWNPAEFPCFFNLRRSWDVGLTIRSGMESSVTIWGGLFAWEKSMSIERWAGEQGHCPLHSLLWAWHSICFSSKGVLEVPPSPALDVVESDPVLASNTSGKRDGREAVPPSELALQYSSWCSGWFPPSFLRALMG